MAQATNGENSDSFVTLDTLVLDSSIQSDRGPDSNRDGANDDNNVPPVVTDAILHHDGQFNFGHRYHVHPDDRVGIGNVDCGPFHRYQDHRQ